TERIYRVEDWQASLTPFCGCSLTALSQRTCCLCNRSFQFARPDFFQGNSTRVWGVAPPRQPKTGSTANPNRLGRCGLQPSNGTGAKILIQSLPKGVPSGDVIGSQIQNCDREYRF